MHRYLDERCIVYFSLYLVSLHVIFTDVSFTMVNPYDITGDLLVYSELA